MARGRKTALTIRLTPAQRHTLLAWQRSTTIGAGRVRRGRMILLLAEQMPIATVAATVGISRRFVYKWAQRFVEAGLDGLAGKSGRGRRRGPPRPALAESVRRASAVPFWRVNAVPASGPGVSGGDG